MRNKKNSQIAMNNLVKLALMLTVIIVIFAIIYVVVRPSLGEIKDKDDEKEPDTKNIFDDISNLFGGCNEGKKRCAGDYIQKCIDDKWVTEDKCPISCDKERVQCE